MKFFAFLLLAGSAMAQTSAGPATAQLPIKAGEWKMVAVVHNAEGDLARSFFSCNTQTDLAHLVPQPSHLPAGLDCKMESQTLTENGEVLVFSCKSTSALLQTTYVLTRNSDILVTGTMKLVADINGQHQESTTRIAYQWQQDQCVEQDAKPGAANPPSLQTP